MIINFFEWLKFFNIMKKKIIYKIKCNNITRKSIMIVAIAEKYVLILIDFRAVWGTGQCTAVDT